MVINGDSLLHSAPIKDMLITKKRAHGVSHGLTEAGYDIRIKQMIRFCPSGYPGWGDDSIVFRKWTNSEGTQVGDFFRGRFVLASAIEEFDMPSRLVGVVHDKSTWARKGLSVFNTVIEPGWRGFLTLELVYHGNEDLVIPAGAGIAQVIFSELAESNLYKGKYQDQEDSPVPARES